MQIMRRLFGALFLLGILACIPGHVFADTMFEADDDLQKAAIENNGSYVFTAAGSPYVFNHGITIDQSITITGEPGAVLKIVAPYSIRITQGHFSLNGSVGQPVVVTSDGFFGQFSVGNTESGTPVVDLSHVQIEKGSYCFISGGGAQITLDAVYFGDCLTGALTASSSTNLTAKNLYNDSIQNNQNGVFVYIQFSSAIQIDAPMQVTISNTDFPQDGFHDIKISDQSSGLADLSAIHIKIDKSNFTGTVKFSQPIRVDSVTDVLVVDASGNYWGIPEGPFIPGATERTDGPMLATNISFVPFLTDPFVESIPEVDPPPDPEPLKECCSSVMFFPGIEGSRLYRADASDPDGQDQLWEPNIPSDVAELYMDGQGNSVEGIYTGEVIEESNITSGSPLDKKFYKKISNNLQQFKEDKVIADYIPLPYDWRVSVDDIIDNGITLANGQNINIVAKVEEMAAASDTGKVTIITHSNGGLLVKALVQELEQQGKEDLLDKVVIVAPPQTGTPDAAYAILHGLDFGFPFEILSPQKYNRKLAENIPMAYTLLPSKKYYETNSHPVFFDESIQDDNNLYQSYGPDIDSYDELKSFILAKTDGRESPDWDETGQPGVGNEYLYDKAEALHAELDDYVFPENIKLYQVSGTGVATNQAILYKDRKLAGKQIVTPYLIKSIYGDGTVLNKSSTIMPGDNYYFDLHNYNKDNDIDLNHANMFEADPLVDFVNHVIQNQDVASPYISTTRPDYSSLRSVSIEMHSPVYMHVYDQEGNHTGPIITKDGNSDDVVTIEQSIPNSHYEILGETVIITLSGNQEYTIKLDGYDDGEFTLNINNYVGDEKVSSQNFENLPATNSLVSEIIINPNNPITQIILDTNGDSNPDLTADSDGTVIDLNKKDEIIFGSVVPIMTSNMGVLEPVVLTDSIEPVIVEEVPMPIVVVSKKTKTNIEPPVVKRNVAVKKSNTKGDIIVPVNTVAVTNKPDLVKSQMASAGNIRFRFNLVDFIKRIFRKK